eukprot:IDg9386t1
MSSALIQAGIDNQKICLAAASAAMACAANALSVLHFLNAKSAEDDILLTAVPLYFAPYRQRRTRYSGVFTHMGSAWDFIMSINITKIVLLECILPLFEGERVKAELRKPIPLRSENQRFAHLYLNY